VQSSSQFSKCFHRKIAQKPPSEINVFFLKQSSTIQCFCTVYSPLISCADSNGAGESSVGIATRLRASSQRKPLSVPCSGKRRFLPQSHNTSCGVHLAPYSKGTGRLFLGVYDLGVNLTTHLHAVRLTKDETYMYTPCKAHKRTTLCLLQHD
jgi:hypothetical protein